MLKLPALPYAYDALAPTLSAETLRVHHDKHHSAYVEKTNALAKKAGVDGKSLEDLVRLAREKNDQLLFNNAAQAWNHGFFWECMTPRAAAPKGGLKTAIEKIFGGFDAFKEAFVKQGVDHFGSGWVWLTSSEAGLGIIATHDADSALVHEGQFPLLCCDLWEHAYYLDYKNDRPGFLKSWFDNVANWDFAARQLEAAHDRAKAYRYPLAA